MSKQLPPGWATAQIGELFHTETGATPPKSDAQNYGTHIPLVKPPELRDGPVNSAEDGLSEAGASLARVLPPWSVLVSCIGNLGKTALNVVPVAFNQQINAILPNAELANPWFLLYQCQSARFRRALLGLSSATTIAIVNKSKFNSLELCVAPRPEQDRIVSKIDELFSRIDEGERALERVRKLVERYRQSVLKAAVTGELTREWREKNKDKLESGEALLARILKARREAWEKAELQKMKAKGITPANDKWKQKYEEPSPPNTTGLPELPEDWVWVSLDQFAAPVERAIQSGPFGSNLLHSEFQSEGKLVIGIDNVRDGWYSPGSQNRISEKKFEQLRKYQARPKDFLITVMATIGRTCVLPDDVEPAIITKHVYRFTLDHSLALPEFVNLCVIGSPAVRSQIFGNVRGQTRPGLNKSILMQFGFPLPPIEEQRLVLDRSAELLSRLAPGKESIAVQQLRSSGLRHAVLKSAFEGRLVAQSPTDEPASALLERIAAARGTDTAAPKRGRKSPLSPDPSPARGEG